MALARSKEKLSRNNDKILGAGEQSLDPIDEIPEGYKWLEKYTEVNEYLNTTFPIGKYSGDYTNLKEDEGAITAVIRALIRTRAPNPLQTTKRTLVPHATPTPEQRRNLTDEAKNLSGQGVCDFVARELAGYFGGNASELLDLSFNPDPTKAGNHSIAFKDVNGERWIFDGTWRQFAGRIGAGTQPEWLLAGSLDSIRNYLEPKTGRTLEAYRLLEFYYRAGKMKAKPQWLTEWGSSV
jgi:hypothetical protein